MDILHTHVCVKQDLKAVAVKKRITVSLIYAIPKIQGSVEMNSLHTHVCVKQDLKVKTAA